MSLVACCPSKICWRTKRSQDREIRDAHLNVVSELAKRDAQVRILETVSGELDDANAHIERLESAFEQEMSKRWFKKPDMPVRERNASKTAA